VLPKRLTYSRPHRLAKLAGELAAAVPALRPSVSADGVLTANMLLSGDGQALALVVPDSVPEATVAAVVAAHDPTAPSAEETRDTARAANEDAWKTELRALLVRLEAGTATAADQRRVAGLLVRIVLRVLD
jgi:hypothetical protein